MANGVNVSAVIDENVEEKTFRDFRRVVSDAFAFIRSAEANQALATVSLDELIGDQIKRNGESESSNAAQFNPYSHDPKEGSPAGVTTSERANFLGAADGNRPTKLDRVLAIRNALSDVITEIKNREVTEVANAEEYLDASEVAIEDEA